jgi:hypothetical protein
VAVVLCAGLAAQRRAPVADHHQHVASSAITKLLYFAEIL